MYGIIDTFRQILVNLNLDKIAGNHFRFFGFVYFRRVFHIFFFLVHNNTSDQKLRKNTLSYYSIYFNKNHIIFDGNPVKGGEMKKNEKKRSIIPNLWYGYIDWVFLKINLVKTGLKE